MVFIRIFFCKKQFVFLNFPQNFLNAISDFLHEVWGLSVLKSDTISFSSKMFFSQEAFQTFFIRNKQIFAELVNILSVIMIIFKNNGFLLKMPDLFMNIFYRKHVKWSKLDFFHFHNIANSISLYSCKNLQNKFKEIFGRYVHVKILFCSSFSLQLQLNL